MQKRPGKGADVGAQSRPTNPTKSSGAAVVGLQWGDEGKGKVIDLLTPGHAAVVRYNGGANAGHSVVIAGKRHATHLVPSGVFHPGVLAVIGNGVVVDPLQLLSEIDQLQAAGLDVAGLRVSDRAHLVLPYHKEEDERREAALTGGERGRALGTTKRGIGPAYSDKATRSTSLRVGDLLRPDVLQRRLTRIAPLKAQVLQALDAERPVDERFIDVTGLVELCRQAGSRLERHICDTTYLLHDLLAEGKTILFEGANATLLDVDHGTYPFVTSSSSSSLGIPAGSGVPMKHIGEVIGVFKAYCTRVGAGPFPTEQDNAIGERVRERGHEYGTTTGRPRRCGWLDLVALRYAVLVNGVDKLALMLLDVLAGFDELKVCTAYQTAAGRTDRFLPDAEALAAVEAVYQTFPGFAAEINEVRSRDDLPAAARGYIAFIEEFVEAPVEIISVGPDRAQTIMR